MHVEIRGLKKRYGGTPALADVNLDFPPGRVVALIGLNGAGKTTLLRCLAGLVSANSGTLRYDGVDFRRDRLDLRRRYFFMPDFPVLYGDMTVLQHVSLLLRVYGVDAAAVGDPLFHDLAELDLLPLAEMPLAQVSRGQLYKAALAGLFAVRPELWLLDEPFASGLDPQGIAVLKQRARTHAAAGGTVVYSTQILEIAERFCDTLVVIDHGKVVHTFDRTELSAMPPTGPDSLESRLRQFREVPT